jgi:hypothetical protein
VEAQRQADATPIPKLSERAQAAVATLATATDEKAQVALWRGMTSDKTIGAELRQFSAAVQRRFGDDTIRAMLRSGGAQVEAASVPRQHQAAFAAVSRTVHTLKEGEYANVRQSSRAAYPAPGARIPARTEAVSNSRRRRSVAPSGSST